jgi:D-glycero-alpha-D-manno-heptose 1-phosphate guanylyltransferase
MSREAIILAGGFGTRLREVVADVPKPIAPIAGQPFLNYILKYLKHFGFDKAVLSVGYQGEKIQDLYGNEFEGIKLEYAFEDEPLGTGGAIKFSMLKTTSEEVLVLNGDTFFEVDLDELYQVHEELLGDVTMVLREVEKPDRYGTVVLAEYDRVSQFNEKQEGLKSGLINGGVYLIDRGAFELVPLDQKFSIEQDYYAKYLELIKIHGYISTGYFIDIGIPEDYYTANEAFKGFKY